MIEAVDQRGGRDHEMANEHGRLRSHWVPSGRQHSDHHCDRCRHPHQIRSILVHHQQRPHRAERPRRHRRKVVPPTGGAATKTMRAQAPLLEAATAIQQLASNRASMASPAQPSKMTHSCSTGTASCLRPSPPPSAHTATRYPSLPGRHPTPRRSWRRRRNACLSCPRQRRWRTVRLQRSVGGPQRRRGPQRREAGQCR